MPQGIVATILGTPTRFCNGNCKDSFREDRRAGLIYPACAEVDEKDEIVRNANGQPVLVGWQESSYKHKWCAYCRESLPGHSPDEYWLVYAEKGKNPTSDESRFVGAWKAKDRKAAALLARGSEGPLPQGWAYVVTEHLGKSLDQQHIKN